MQQEQLYLLLARTDQQVQQLVDTVAQLKQTVNDLMNENNRLQMHNHDLQDAILSYEQSKPKEAATQAPQPTLKSKERLQTYYDEGIHVCRTYFGARRESAEACIFCQDILDSLSDID